MRLLLGLSRGRERSSKFSPFDEGENKERARLCLIGVEEGKAPIVGFPCRLMNRG
jgi:hypothetical protein